MFKVWHNVVQTAPRYCKPHGVDVWVQQPVVWGEGRRSGGIWPNRPWSPRDQRDKVLSYYAICCTHSHRGGGEGQSKEEDVLNVTAMTKR